MIIILPQVVIVIFVILVGAFEVDMSNWSPFAPNGYKAIVTGATVVFFAYVGFDAVANSAEESKNPQVVMGMDYMSILNFCLHSSTLTMVVLIICLFCFFTRMEYHSTLLCIS